MIKLVTTNTITPTSCSMLEPSTLRNMQHPQSGQTVQMRALIRAETLVQALQEAPEQVQLQARWQARQQAGVQLSPGAAGFFQALRHGPLCHVRDMV